MPGHHLRAVADVLVHRALRQQPPGGLERGAAAAGGADLGDYLRAAGVRTALVGKTHATASLEGMRRLGIDPASARGAGLAEAGFEPTTAMTGSPDDPAFADKRKRALHPLPAAPRLHRRQPLARLGQLRPPAPTGNPQRLADAPCRIADTLAGGAARPPIPPVAPWFIDERGERPWCLHLSYIKPHWPTSRRRRTTRCTAPTRCSRRYARRPAKKATTRCTAPSANIARASISPAKTCAGR